MIAHTRKGGWTTAVAFLVILPALTLVFVLTLNSGLMLQISAAIGIVAALMFVLEVVWRIGGNVSAKHGAVKIKPSPATFLLRIADLLPAKYAFDLRQNVSDLRIEYYEALKEHKFWRAKIIIAAYYIGIGWTVIRWVMNKIKELIGIIPSKNDLT